MSLRKYLRNAWVTGIDQYEFERIVTVSFGTKTGILKLVVELFGEGNIILTNEQNVIIHALAYKKMRDRRHPSQRSSSASSVQAAKILSK